MCSLQQLGIPHVLLRHTCMRVLQYLVLQYTSIVRPPSSPPPAPLPASRPAPPRDRHPQRHRAGVFPANESRSALFRLNTAGLHCSICSRPPCLLLRPKVPRVTSCLH